MRHWPRTDNPQAPNTMPATKAMKMREAESGVASRKPRMRAMILPFISLNRGSVNNRVDLLLSLAENLTYQGAEALAELPLEHILIDEGDQDDSVDEILVLASVALQISRDFGQHVLCSCV